MPCGLKLAFRIVTDTIGECYQALGVIHAEWHTIPGRFKDYISTPKRNGYQSLHTSVIHDSKMRIEIQIRSREMHELGMGELDAAVEADPESPSARVARATALLRQGEVEKAIADLDKAIELDDEAAARKTLRLIDALEELDDVNEVYANFDIPEQLLEAVAS